MEDLQSLVKQRLTCLLRHHGVTAADASRRATRAGFPVTEQRLSQLSAMPAGHRMGRVPDRRTLYGLAVALALPRERVVDAALRSTGYVIPVRMYAHTAGTTDRGACTHCPTRVSHVEELIVVLPEPDLTAGEIALFVRAFEQVAARVRARRARSE